MLRSGRNQEDGVGRRAYYTPNKSHMPRIVEKIVRTLFMQTLIIWRSQILTSNFLLLIYDLTQDCQSWDGIEDKRQSGTLKPDTLGKGVSSALRGCSSTRKKTLIAALRLFQIMGKA